MLARVVRAALCPGRRDEAIALYEGTVLPALRAQLGFTGALFLTDRSTGHVVSLTFWDEATMEADPNLFRRHLAAFETMTAEPFAVELYEVSAATPLPLDGLALLPEGPAGQPVDR